MNSPSHMWPYWRDKKGFDDALTYHAETIAADPVLTFAVMQRQVGGLAAKSKNEAIRQAGKAQFHVAQSAINARFAELAEKEETVG